MRAILTFHSIDDSGSVISYPVHSFRLLIEKLHQENIPVLGLDELLGNENKPGVALTFDDGIRSVYQSALPVLKEYGVTGHVFVTTRAIEKGGKWPTGSDTVPGFEMMGWSELEKLHDAGIHIDAHTHTHPDLRTLHQDQIAEECLKADELIENRLGRKPDYFAYPFGYHNRLCRDFVRNHYKASVTTELKSLSGAHDSAVLPRLDSYYFRTPVSVSLLGTYAMNLYFSLRNVMRNVKGSQCRHDD